MIHPPDTVFGGQNWIKNPKNRWKNVIFDVLRGVFKQSFGRKIDPKRGRFTPPKSAFLAWIRGFNPEQTVWQVKKGVKKWFLGQKTHFPRGFLGVWRKWLKNHMGFTLPKWPKLTKSFGFWAFSGGGGSKMHFWPILIENWPIFIENGLFSLKTLLSSNVHYSIALRTSDIGFISLLRNAMESGIKTASLAVAN